MRKAVRLAGVSIAALLLAIPAVASTAVAKKKGKKKPGVVSRSATTSGSGTGTILTATATCPKRTRALGGGFQLSTPPPGNAALGLIFESQKIGQRSWKASAQLIDAGPPDTLGFTTHVYCRKGAPSTATARATLPKPDGGVSKVGPAPVAGCAGKKKAMFGGLLTEPPIGVVGAEQVNVESVRTSSKTWQSNYLYGPLGANSLTTFAYCAKGKVPAAVTAVSPSGTPSTSVVSVAAKCPRKKKVVGGGFSEPLISLAPPLGGYFLPFESLRESATKWRVSGIKIGISPATIASTAYCA